MEILHKTVLARLSERVVRLFATVRDAARLVTVRRTVRSLRVCESLAIGERRFLLLVQCDGRRYLLGAAANSITLLDRLDAHANSALGEIGSADEAPWKGLH